MKYDRKRSDDMSFKFSPNCDVILMYDVRLMYTYVPQAK